MLSHDLARALLERRNHDLRFIAEVCLPGHEDDDDNDICSTMMADDRARAVYGMGDDVEVLRYSPEDDVLEVMLGPIFAGHTGEFMLEADDVKLVKRAITRVSPIPGPLMDLLERMRKSTK